MVGTVKALVSRLWINVIDHASVKSSKVEPMFSPMAIALIPSASPISKAMRADNKSEAFAQTLNCRAFWLCLFYASCVTSCRSCNGRLQSPVTEAEAPQLLVVELGFVRKTTKLLYSTTVDDFCDLGH